MTMIWDYVVFVIFIVCTFLVPIYNKMSGPGEKTKADYVFAAGKVPVSLQYILMGYSKVSSFAMILSISRSTLGVRALLGYPSELFYRGSAMWETMYGLVLALPVVCFVFLPVYFNLGITSVYQYLDMRFKSQLVRSIASFTYIMRIVLTLGVTVFTPCVALKTVIGLPYWASIIGITSIGVLFNILGGLKTAIIVDVMQTLVTIGWSCIIIVYGSFKAGGFLHVLQVNQERGRLDFLNFNMDPTVRVTTVSALFGQLFMSASVFGCQQNLVQRYCSMDSQKTVVRTLLSTMPTITVLFSLSWVSGMVMFASYAECDPLSLGYISKIDEIMPFYIQREFANVPGFLGLVMATLFTGALSMTMSNLNSTSTVTWEDFLSQIPRFSGFNDSKQLVIIKCIGVVYGVAVMGMAYAVGMLPGITESSMLVTSATSGPLLGVFILAMLFPCANWKGASIGMLTSHAVTLWITFGGLAIHKPVPQLPLSVDGCNNATFGSYASSPPDWFGARSGGVGVNFNATPVASSLVEIDQSRDALSYLYSVSYMYYSLIGCGLTVLLGVVLSYILGTSPDDAFDEMLIHPVALRLSRLLPGKPRKYVSDPVKKPAAAWVPATIAATNEKQPQST